MQGLERRTDGSQTRRQAAFSDGRLRQPPRLDHPPADRHMPAWRLHEGISILDSGYRYGMVSAPDVYRIQSSI